MNQTDQDQTVVALRRALSAGVLDDQVADLAKQCLSRLTGTVRLSVLGPLVEDATDLVNFLAGRELLGADSGDTLVRLIHAEEPQAVAYYGNETKKSFAGSDIPRAFEDKPQLVKLGSDATALAKVTILRAARAETAALRKATQWAAAKSDVLLWCSHEFTEEEESIWIDLPKRARDHGFLVLPKHLYDVDENRQRGERLFSGVLGIDAAAACAARSHPNGVNKSAFSEAGGTAMVKTVKRELEAIRQGALDAGQVILLRDVPGEDDRKLSFTRPVERSEVDTSKAKADEVAIKPETPKTAAMPAEVQAPATEATLKPEVAKPELVKVSRVSVKPKTVANDPAAMPKQVEEKAVKAKSRPVAKDRPEAKKAEAREEKAQVKRAKKERPVLVEAKESRPCEKKPAAPRASSPAQLLEEVCAIFTCYAKLTTEKIKSGKRPSDDAILHEMCGEVDRAIAMIAESTFADVPEILNVRGMLEEANARMAFMMPEEDDNAALECASILLQLHRDIYLVRKAA